MFIEYGELSTKVYEITKPINHSIDGDIEFYYHLLKNKKGKTLEAGVGTGRMLIPFLEKGLLIEGVDLSKEMLTQCEINLKKQQLTTPLFHQNLLDLNLETTYETIIMPTGSFCLLPKEKIGQVFQRFSGHLETGGELIFDIELPVDFKENQQEAYSFPITKETGILFTSHSQSIDWVNQKISYLHRYEYFEKGILKNSELSHFILYWYGINELKQLMTSFGFETTQVIRGYHKNEQASLFTFIAKKK